MVLIFLIIENKKIQNLKKTVKLRHKVIISCRMRKTKRVQNSTNQRTAFKKIPGCISLSGNTCLMRHLHVLEDSGEALMAVFVEISEYFVFCN